MADKPKITNLPPDSEDSWAEVELYRWQHGGLPKDLDDGKVLEINKGLYGMADAIEKGFRTKDPKIMPAPMNVCAVLRYVARLLEAQAEPGPN